MTDVIHDPSAWNFVNPKRDRRARAGPATWYPYYAGFSPSFATELIRSATRASISIVDPWNGSGTTSHTAAQLGHTTYGFDLNPVMVIVAKARLVDGLERSSLLPLGDQIARGLEIADHPLEPLNKWFDPAIASVIRAIQHSILRLLVPESPAPHVDDFSDLASFYHVALFGVVRDLLRPFRTSNPTWFRQPSRTSLIRGLTQSEVLALFSARVALMASVDTPASMQRPRNCTVLQASSERLPLASNSVDFVLGSPPYCTRIDYAVATLPELAVLGFDDAAVRDLRRELMGTSTVQAESPAPRIEWGSECANFISKLSTHPSKASGGYYYKNHCDYFDRLSRSLGEIARVLKERGNAVLVVQDSYYKNIKNELSEIVIDMAEAQGLTRTRAVNFVNRGSMVFVNSKAKAYADRSHVTESVLCLTRAN